MPQARGEREAGKMPRFFEWSAPPSPGCYPLLSKEGSLSAFQGHKDKQSWTSGGGGDRFRCAKLFPTRRTSHSKTPSLGPRVSDPVGLTVREAGREGLEPGLEACLERRWAGLGATHT